MSYKDAVLADAPVGYWRLNEADGNFYVNDFSGNNRHGHISNPSSVELGGAGPTGPGSGSLRKLATNGTVGIDDPDGFLKGHGGSFSVEGWFRLVDAAGLLIAMGSLSQRLFTLYANSSGIEHELAFESGLSENTYAVSAADGEWRHVVGTWDGSAQRLYVDGVLVDELDTTGEVLAAQDPNQELVLGWFASADTWLSEMAVYHHVLSPDRVEAHYLEATDPPGVPTVTAPEDLVLEAPFYTGASADYQPIADWLAEVSAEDTVDGDISHLVSNDAPEDFPLGETVVTFTVTNSDGVVATAEASAFLYWVYDPEEEPEEPPEEVPETALLVRVRRDPHGNDPRTGDPLEPTSETKVELSGAFVAPSSSEDLEGTSREGRISDLTLFIPPGSDVLRTDFIEVEGELYEIDGEINVWRHPVSGLVRGSTCSLNRVEG